MLCANHVASLLREVASTVCAEAGGSLSPIKPALPQSASLTAPPKEEPTLNSISSDLRSLGAPRLSI